MNEILQTIIQQLGGYSRLMITTGCKISYCNEFDTITFTFPRHSKGKCKSIAIKYDYGWDAYNITTRNLKGNIMKNIEGVYCDQLIPIFERETGYKISGLKIIF